MVCLCISGARIPYCSLQIGWCMAEREKIVAKILVIDDDVDILKLLEVQLQQIGHVMIRAADGGQGLQMLVSSNVDMIITDIFMPGKDGYEFMLEFLHHPPLGVDPKKVPIIAMTGHGVVMNSDSILHIAHKFGACETLQKPFTFMELKKKVEGIFSKNNSTE